MGCAPEIVFFVWAVPPKLCRPDFGCPGLIKSRVFPHRCGKLTRNITPRTDYPAGLVLYHAAAHLRAREFNYLSLESVLSDAGVISQISMNWITLMSSGRNYTYDPRVRLWRASVLQALKDMRLTRRSTDLIDWEIANEFV